MYWRDTNLNNHVNKIYGRIQQIRIKIEYSKSLDDNKWNEKWNLIKIKRYLIV